MKINEAKRWKLHWAIFSKDLLDSGLFIPYPKKGKEKPSAKGVIERIINEKITKYFNDSLNPIGYENVRIADLVNSSLGNLKKICTQQLNLDLSKELPILYFIKLHETSSLPPSIILNISFPNIYKNSASIQQQLFDK